ncbi:hypothetical protein ACFQU2_05595 [Siccirubricoccus deserti]
MPTLTRLGILDDYQGVTLALGPGTGCRTVCGSTCSAIPSPTSKRW